MDACKLLDSVNALVDNKKYDINCDKPEFSGFSKFYFSDKTEKSRLKVLGVYTSFIRFIQHICEKSATIPSTTTTTTSTTTSTTTTTQAPLNYTGAAYVGLDNIEPLTEVLIPFSFGVEKIINTPVSETGLGFFFLSVPTGKNFTVYDMMRVNVTSEFDNFGTHTIEGYEENTIWKKRDMYDITGSTVFYVTISNP